MDARYNLTQASWSSDDIIRIAKDVELSGVCYSGPIPESLFSNRIGDLAYKGFPTQVL